MGLVLFCQSWWTLCNALFIHVYTVDTRILRFLIILDDPLEICQPFSVSEIILGAMRCFFLHEKWQHSVFLGHHRHLQLVEESSEATVNNLTFQASLMHGGTLIPSDCFPNRDGQALVMPSFVFSGKLMAGRWSSEWLVGFVELSALLPIAARFLRLSNGRRLWRLLPARQGVPGAAHPETCHVRSQGMPVALWSLRNLVWRSWHGGPWKCSFLATLLQHALGKFQPWHDTWQIIANQSCRVVGNWLCFRIDLEVGLVLSRITAVQMGQMGSDGDGWGWGWRQSDSIRFPPRL